MSMHSLLAKQLKRASRADGSVDWERLLELVGGAYAESDRDRRIGDRSVALMQEELQSLNKLIQEDAEAQLNAIMDNVGEAVIVIGTDAGIQTVNKAALRIFGYEGAELVGANVSILMDGSDRGSHDSWVSHYLAGGPPKIIGKGREVQGRRKNGEIFPIDLSIGEMVLRKKGRLFIGIIRDITARKQADEKLKASERRFRDLVEASSDWFWETDDRHRYVYVSPRVREKLGIAPESLIGRAMTECWRENKPSPVWEEHLQSLAAHRSFRDFVFTVELPGKPAQCVRSSGMPIFDGDGTFVGYRGTANNITAELEAEERARQAEQQLVDGIEAINDGFALYGKDDRLSLCNSQYRQLFKEVGEMVGQTFEAIARRAAEQGVYCYEGPALESFMASRLAEHANPSGRAVLHPLQGGRWMISKEFRTRSGGVVGIRTDVTALKRREEEVEALKQRYELILGSAGDGIVGVDADEIVTFANPAACRMLDVFGPALEGENYRLALFGSVAACGLRPFPLDGTDSESGETSFRRRDGSTFIAEFILAPIHEDGKFKGAVLVFRDISLRKRYEESIVNQQRELERQVAERTRTLSSEVKRRALTEQALMMSQGRLKGITSSLFEGVLLVDIRGHIVFANRSAHRLLQAEAGQLPGTELDEAFHILRDGEVVPFDESPFPRVIETGETVIDDDATFLTKAGRRFVAYATSPLEEDGKRRAAIISFRSIEALKEAQRETLQSSRLASVGQLAAGIAHEINTPIQYVGDNLRFLKESFGSIAAAFDEIKALLSQCNCKEDLRRLLEEKEIAYLLEEVPLATAQSLDGVEHVAHIVRSMKEFSHPGSKAKVATDINRAIDSTVTVSTNEWKQVARVETDLAPDLPPIICFPAEINQVLLNLIVNAAHAIDSAKPERPGVIRISTRREGGAIEIRVSDTGPGVPPSIRDKIYDPFFTTKEVGKGTGQGLAISFDVIVNKHGGKIFLDETVAEGATFVVVLPIGDSP